MSFIQLGALSRRLTLVGLAVLAVALSVPAHAPAIDTEDPGYREALQALEDVRVSSFTRWPGTIGPFGGVAQVSWNVEGREDLVALEFNGERVPFRGSRIVSPLRTTDYGLVAVAKDRRRGLGRVTVSVDRSACTDLLLANPDPAIFMANLLEQRIDAPLSLRDGKKPRVTFESGHVRLRMWLRKDIDHRPDPSIDIVATFALGLDDGRLVAREKHVGASASLPAWAESYPGVEARLRAGEREARVDMLSAIDDLARALDLFYRANDDPANDDPVMARQDVVIDSGGIRVTECPAPLPGGALEDNEAEA